jgi:hypothetical protein
MRKAIIIAIMVLSPLLAFHEAAACSGCGCRGGPGYRAPDGRCVSWGDIARKCGSPPTTRCAAEGQNAGAEDAAKFGVKAIKAK